MSSEKDGGASAVEAVPAATSHRRWRNSPTKLDPTVDRLAARRIDSEEHETLLNERKRRVLF